MLHGRWRRLMAISGLAAGLWFASLGSDGTLCPPAQAAISYTVKSGDCLWTIANRFGISVDSLRSANGLASDRINIGQVLTIPTGRTAPAPVVSRAAGVSGKTVDYTVVKGDTLWGLATRFRTTVAAVKAANGLTGDSLSVGKKLKIPAGAVSPQAPSPPTAPAGRGDTEPARDILSYAYTLLGTPYRSGGTGPKGFDCSGFVYHVMGKFGVSLPRTSQEQFKCGEAVEKGELQPGDLVFFTTYGPGATHVGIYTGSDSFIHSSSPRSGGVITTPMSDGYYSTRYLGARRVL